MIFYYFGAIAAVIRGILEMSAGKEWKESLILASIFLLLAIATEILEKLK